ncbi:MAG: hypothetical protein ACRDRX_18540 [Pseudonocardiaceae bacterium]
MHGNRRKVRDEFHRTVSALAEAGLTGDAAAAEAAITRLGELLPAMRRHDPVLEEAVALVGQSAGRLLTGREAALRPALAVFRALLLATPFDSGLHPTMLMMVGEDLLRAARQTHERYLVDEAVTLGEAAVTAAEPGSQLQAIMLSGLGEAYQLRFGDLGDPADLDRAIDSYRMAADRIDPDMPSPIPERHEIGREVHALCLDRLGSCLTRKFEQTTDPQVLDDAITVRRRALRTIPADDLNRPKHLNKLGVALHRQYRETGCADALNEAVALSAEAVSTGVPDSSGYASWVNTHAVFLLERFALTADRSDLEQASTLLRNVARAERSGSTRQAMHHSTLATALITQYHLTSDPAVLAEAVAVSRQALAATPAGHPFRPGRLTGLGDAVQETFVRSDDLTALDEAISLYREAIAASPPQHPGTPQLLGNLGVALGQRYKAGGGIEQLNEGIILLQQAVTSLADDHPNRAMAQSNLDKLVELRAGSDH